MTNDHRHDEQLRQTAAERIEREGADIRNRSGAVDAYRFIHRMVRSAPMHRLPDTFAAQVSRIAEARDDSGRLEDWIVVIALTCAVAAAIAFAGPIVSHALPAMVNSFPDLPWPMLFGSLLAFALVAFADRLLPFSNASAP
jgi:hypothetical protein